MFGNWIAASWDKLSPGRHILLGIERWIFRERSPYQEVAIASVPGFGRGLFLDGLVQFTERDEFVYHEHFALPPLLFHENPRRVLIQGGGDGLALREVLRDPRVEEVVLVEIDRLVVEACRKHLAELHRGSFDNPRAEIRIQNVLDYLSGPAAPFDVVLVDLIDAYQPASLELYAKVLPLTRRALAPGAIVGLFGDMMGLRITPIYLAANEAFRHVELHRACIGSFGGEYGFLLASDEVDFHKPPAGELRKRADWLAGDLRALIPEQFPTAFLIPPSLRRHFQEAVGKRGPHLSLPSAKAEWVFPPSDQSG
ncbi:MAG: hypothetical protein ACE5JI_03160 [Acidobacteriota bacterium]